MKSIIVDSITKTFGSRKAVDDLSFTVKKGSIHGFLGPNGAGKTTTMKMIAGVIPPTSGNIYINGNNVQENLLKIKSSLGVLLETPPLYKDMEVRKFLKYICKLHGVKEEKINEYLDYAIKKLDLKHIENRLIGNLSKGYKQRVGVAQAIVFQPEIVILDEPTVGLDPNSVIEMRDLIKELAQDHTVLLSSHLLHEVGLLCDEVTIIKDGVLQVSGNMSTITQKVNECDHINAKVKVWQDSLGEELLSLKSVDRLEVINLEDSFQLKIYIKNSNDIRVKISTFLVSKNVGLLEFTKEEIDLEKFFLEVTGGQE